MCLILTSFRAKYKVKKWLNVFLSTVYTDKCSTGSSTKEQKLH